MHNMHPCCHICASLATTCRRRPLCSWCGTPSRKHPSKQAKQAANGVEAMLCPAGSSHPAANCYGAAAGQLKVGEEGAYVDAETGSKRNAGVSGRFHGKQAVASEAGEAPRLSPGILDHSVPLFASCYRLSEIVSKQRFASRTYLAAQSGLQLALP